MTYEPGKKKRKVREDKGKARPHRQKNKPQQLQAQQGQAQKKVPVSESEFPVDEPLWTFFVYWVNHGRVVTKDLLKGRKEAWEIIWLTFKAGYGVKRSI